jgi:hypothetical protein
MLTSAVVQQVFGHPPRLVPLLTARFIEDGPGKRYIAEHCRDHPFTVCQFAGKMADDSQLFLWSSTPGDGVYLLADPETRDALAQEDTAFAWAVFKAYPLQQSKMLLWNLVEQSSSFDSGWLNYGCFDQPGCWDTVPPALRATMARSLSGRNLWPDRAITALHYTVVCLSLAVLLIGVARIASRIAKADERERLYLLWIALLVAALIVNAFLGGSISEPQSRYQGRVIWLLPFAAWIYLAMQMQKGRREALAPAPAL